MRNQSGQEVPLMSILTAEKLRAVQAARKRSADLAAACAIIGDTRNYRLASLYAAGEGRLVEKLQATA